MNLREELHLSDKNGSAVVSSHFVGVEATTQPSKSDTIIR